MAQLGGVLLTSGEEQALLVMCGEEILDKKDLDTRDLWDSDGEQEAENMSSCVKIGLK